MLEIQLYNAYNEQYITTIYIPIVPQVGSRLVLEGVSYRIAKAPEYHITADALTIHMFIYKAD